MAKDRNETTLERISIDLVNKFETEDVPDLNKGVDDYFSTRTKQDEIAGELVTLTTYKELSDVVKQEIVPLYQEYDKRRNEIVARKDKRKLWKYVVPTIAALEILEFVVTQGQSLRPQILVPTLLAEAWLGWVFYRTAQFVDNQKLRSAQKKFLNTVKAKNENILTNQKYETLQEVLDGSTLRAEAYSVLSQYENSQMFWSDYEKIRRANPTTPEELQRLDTPQFEGFLELHVKKVYSPEKMESRFDKLSLLGHEYFLKESRNYAQKARS